MRQNKHMPASVWLAMVALLVLLSVCLVHADTTGNQVIINQVYGGSNDGYASHSFIELYNPTDQDISLKGWTLQYKSSASGNQKNDWAVLPLTGTIAKKDYYLVRCKAVAKPSGSYKVPAGNQEWDMMIHNKGISVALVKSNDKLGGDVSGDVTRAGYTRPAALIDLAAVQGNDASSNQIPPAYEGAYSAIQSKKKAIRRKNFADTDKNSVDFAEVNYSKAVSAANGPHVGTAPAEPVEPPKPTFTPGKTTGKKYYGMDNDTAELKAELSSRFNAGAYSADGGSAEITAYNKTNQYAYSVNGVKGVLDAIDMTALQNGEKVQDLKGKEIKVADLVAGADKTFTYGDMTSVAVSPDGKTVAVALQDEDYKKTGRVAFFACAADGSLTLKGLARTGVQPDNVVFTEDGTKVLTADEGEPRQGYSAAGAVDPKGSVTIADPKDFSARTVGFDAFDSQRAKLASAGVVLKKGTVPSADLEPEYIAVAGGTAYVSLQEANAIAVLDIAAGSFTGIYPVGLEDYSKVPVDLNKGDAKYAPQTYEKIRGIRMPDGIAAASIGGTTYLLTANEGDSRAWPVSTEADTNEIKSKTSPVNGIKTGGKVPWFDASQYDGLPAGNDYVFGGRSFTIFKVTGSGLEEVYDSASDFEKITAAKVPAHFNCSNDTVEIEDRSGKKGPEAESVTIGEVKGHTYAFVGLERTSGVMIYDITDPAQPRYVNYMNSRDYSEDILDDVSPEGLLFIPAAENSMAAPLLMVSNEVSGTVSVNKLIGPPIITKGQHGEWKKGSKDGLAFTSDADFKDFRKVLVDGKEISADSYTVEEGSTVVTLKPAYLEGLALGKHTLGIQSANGTAETDFYIRKAASQGGSQVQPSKTQGGAGGKKAGSSGVHTSKTGKTSRAEAPVKTGDEAPILTLMIVLAAATILVIILKRRQMDQEDK